MGRKSSVVSFKSQGMSILLTCGLIFQGFSGLAVDGQEQIGYKDLYQKLMSFQPKEDSEAQKTLKEGELPLLNVEKIELEELKVELTQELVNLQTKIAQLQKQISEIDEELVRYQVPQSISLTTQELKSLMLNQIEDCSISKIKDSNIYKITNHRSESIRFLFSEVGSETAPFAKLISLESQNDGIELTQPSFKSVSLDVTTEMSATIRYKVKDDGLKFVFVTFLGQRIEDKIFGRSSFEPFRVICKTSI